jgi:hypothetical protein
MIEDGIVVYAKSSYLEKGKPFEFALSLLSAGIRLICSSRHTMNARSLYMSALRLTTEPRGAFATLFRQEDSAPGGLPHVQ